MVLYFRKIGAPENIKQGFYLPRIVFNNSVNNQSNTNKKLVHHVATKQSSNCHCMNTLKSAVASLALHHFTMTKTVTYCVPAKNEDTVHAGAVDSCPENSQRHRKQDQMKPLMVHPAMSRDFTSTLAWTHLMHVSMLVGCTLRSQLCNVWRNLLCHDRPHAVRINVV
jgi:hypothetical protein